jgi:hypothetical protein
MIQGGDRTGFSLEPLREFLLRYLDRNDSVQPCVAGFVDLAMPPAPIGARIS